MFIQPYLISEHSFVSDIVERNYHTVDIFLKYDIEVGDSAQTPLLTVCESKGLDSRKIIKELEDAIRPIHVPGSIAFRKWPLDFLIDYIVYVHHVFLKEALPQLNGQLEKFEREHKGKYSYLPELRKQFERLCQDMLSHLEQEETVIFPYIRQIAHAYYDKDTYARLLARTLRKPVEEMMHAEHKMVVEILQSFRKLTGGYTLPEGASLDHTVIFMKLREIDNDLTQHVYLENYILFPKALAIEKEVLKDGGKSSKEQ